MRLKVERKWFNEKTTIGELSIDNAFECFTLEDRIRAPGVKVKGLTAIPLGLYTVVIDFSQRFQRLMPHVLYVPMFEGIRIHAGNTSKDTEGCLLVGTARQDVERILNSRVAYDKLFPVLDAACRVSKVQIEYINVNPPPELLHTA